ncbi:MAG: UvrD-helicase domain-containing protein [Nonlabens sp.]
MNAPTTFYSASAGSGKTFTLARDYLTLLFQSPYHNSYRSILAVTFTNKAVAEMKERIMDYLHKFTKEEVPASLSSVAAHIKDATGMDDDAFQKKAVNLHNRLLHDYSAFDIVTIDAFNHRILRTFSRDLNLPEGFEVELDSKYLIAKAVYNLIARAGDDKNLTDRLIDFSLFKINEGKSWDIEYDLISIGDLISKETHYKHLQQLKSKNLEDFVNLEKSLYKNIATIEKSLTDQATRISQKATAYGIKSEDFKGGKSRSPFKLIEKVIQNDFSVKLDEAPIKNFLNGDLYTKTMDDSTRSGIESLEGDLKVFAENYTQLWGKMSFKKEVLKNLTPLSLLNEIVAEIDTIKNDEKIVPIYEFNGLLAEEIKNQPAPFIYERLGERYTHFFVDEFQDTSYMQWENMAPLVSNALQQETTAGKRGSLMLVGDAKQSIYRWRGGDLDQFLTILDTPDLFMLEKKQENLEFNWRSYDDIIEFNNDFFEFYSNYLDDPIYKNLYQKHLKQQTRNKNGGYVQIDFIDKDHFTNDEEEAGVYPTHVKSLVDQAMGNGFQAGEICILVRTNKQGNDIATHLVAEGISVISGDSLLIQHSSKVQTLANLMNLLLMPEQQEPKLDFLMSYAQHREITDASAFIERHISMDLEELLKTLSKDVEDGLDSAFAKAALFQSAENLAYQMHLLEQPDTRMQTFLDFLFEFSQGKDSSLSGFLEDWNLKKDNLSVPAMQDQQAVQIMTVHKSKGLEFPVVIVPHVDMPLQDTRREYAWAPVDNIEFMGFEEVFISLKKELEFYPKPLPEVFRAHSNKSQMDQINLLYVAFTRCREQLFIACKDKPEPKSGTATPNHSQILKRFLSSRDYKENNFELGSRFSTGTEIRNSVPDKVDAPNIITNYIRTSKNNLIEVSTTQGLLWAAGNDEAIAMGTQLHYFLSLIKTENDFESVAKEIEKADQLAREEKEYLCKKLNDILNDREIGALFKTDVEVMNEAKLLLANGSKQIPDRLHKSGNKITIIDYKTGKESAAHHNQLKKYQNTLVSMGYEVDEKFLVYTDEMKMVAVD